MSNAHNSIEPATMRFIGDSGHKGTNFYWQDRLAKWVVVNLENNECSTHDGLALVRCASDPEEGLNQNCLGCDLDANGLWLVDSQYLDEVESGYLFDVCKLIEE